MKKIAAVIFILAAAATRAEAASGDVAGRIYSTDIIARINGQTAESYNIGGRTVIILEGLEKYGAEVDYDDSLRTLTVNTVRMDIPYEVQAERGEAGRTVGNIYESNIRTYLNGCEIKTYSLDGRMAAAIEDIGGDNSWSQYNGRYIWDDESRTISLELPSPGQLGNEDVLSEYARENELELRFDLTDGELAVDVRRWYTGTSYGGNYQAAADGSIYCGGEAVGQLFNFKNAYIFNGSIEFGEEKVIRWELDKIIPIIESKTPALKYEDTMAYIEECYMPVGTVHDRFDTEDYTFIYMTTSLATGGYEHLLRIGCDGSFIRYEDEIPSVSHNGSHKFENLVIDKEQQTVSFDYDRRYVIDLETGVME